MEASKQFSGGLKPSKDVIRISGAATVSLQAIGKYPKENTVPYATKERAKVAVGINPETKAYPGDTAD